MSIRRAGAVVFASGCLALLGLSGAVARAEGRRNWTLDVSGEKLGSLSLSRPGGAREQHWYLLFRVENRTGADRPLHLFVKGISDENRTAYEGIYPEAEKAIEGRWGGARLSLGERPAMIKDGEALDCVALLGPVDPEADTLRVQITGLNEPVVREKGKEYHERKALELTFGRWGDEFLISFDLIEPLSRAWIDLEPRAALPHAASPKVK